MLSVGGRGSAACAGRDIAGAGAAGANLSAANLSCLVSWCSAMAAAPATLAVAIGCLSAPEANTVTAPSCSMRTASAAPTRLRLSARIWPLSRLMPETRISAFGALATMVPSGSRTTMSRTRTARAIVGALDLRAADFDALAAAKILFDGGNQPGREGVELDRAAVEPPQQTETAEDQDSDQGAGNQCPPA